MKKPPGGQPGGGGSPTGPHAKPTAPDPQDRLLDAQLQDALSRLLLLALATGGLCGAAAGLAACLWACQP
jgi:hypothetical protein